MDGLWHFHHVRRILLRRARLHDQKVRCRLRLHPRHLRPFDCLRPAVDRVHHCASMHRGHPVPDLRPLHRQAHLPRLLTSGFGLKIDSCMYVFNFFFVFKLLFSSYICVSTKKSKYSIFYSSSGAQFHQRSTYCFYTLRSQKRKKIQMT